MIKFTYILEHDSTGVPDYINKVDSEGYIVGYYCLDTKEWMIVLPDNYVSMKDYKERFGLDRCLFKDISEEEMFLEII